MSENVVVPNITINSTVDSQGSKSILDRILDIGFKLLVPLLLIGALLFAWVIFSFVIPVLTEFGDILPDVVFGSEELGTPPLIGTIPILGGLLSFLFGRS